MNNLLALARGEFARGAYASALRHIQKFVPHGKDEVSERDCLLCECLQFDGQETETLKLAHKGIAANESPALVARFWGTVGRTHLDEMRRQEASDAFSNGIKAAKRSEDKAILATLQQLRLVAAGETLGPGLAPAVREAYHNAIRAAEPAILAGFHIRLARLEGQRGSFDQSFHHLSLAQSLLDRSPHLGLQALFFVNRSALLATTGSFLPARQDSEEAARLADEAGYARLAISAATNNSYLGVVTGELSGVDYWLKRARGNSAQVSKRDIPVLDNLAMFALITGDLASAMKYMAEARSVFDSREHKWASSNEVLTLFTEFHLHRRLENRDKSRSTLATIKTASEAINDKHSGLMAELAEAELLFDEQSLRAGSEHTAICLGRALQHPVYLAKLARLLARDHWIRGRQGRAKRSLIRAASSALLSGTRFEWAEALKEAKEFDTNETWESAYSLTEQLKQGENKFSLLMQTDRPSWFQRTPPGNDSAPSSVDGFEDAIAVLLSSSNSILRGREALASAQSLGAIRSGALIVHTDAGLRAIATTGKPIKGLEAFLKAPNVHRIDVGKEGHRRLELVLEPNGEVSSLFIVLGIRRLLDAATAIEAQKKDQQRMGALWQPELLIEEPNAVFSSPQMIELMQTARKVGATTLPVLLVGDTGTGKEVLARAIHRASPRASKTFLPFNCSAVPRDMVESQLFGFRKGSFTGADHDFLGIIRSAEGGTLFLDEIGELSIDLQPKLLRFLETNEVHPIGEGKPIKVDVRIIAATNADLDDLIQRKLFREDLYYRLNIVRFQIPQLSERREEIPPLVMHMLRRFEMDEKKHSIKLSDELMEYLLLYKWPGNVRQLSNELRKMVAMVSSGETVGADHLAPAIRATRRTVDAEADAEQPAIAIEPPADSNSLTVKLDQPLPAAIEALERAMIEHAIARADGGIEEAARLLGISRKGLFLKRRRWQADGSH